MRASIPLLWPAWTLFQFWASVLPLQVLLGSTSQLLTPLLLQHFALILPIILNTWAYNYGSVSVFYPWLWEAWGWEPLLNCLCFLHYTLPYSSWQMPDQTDVVWLNAGMKEDFGFLCEKCYWKFDVSNQANLVPQKILCADRTHLIMWLNRATEVCWHRDWFAMLKTFCGLEAFSNSEVKCYITIQQIIGLNNAVH